MQEEDAVQDGAQDGARDGARDGAVDGRAPGWARERLAERGVAVLAAELVKHRPWSTVWRLSTPDGPVWLKACPGATRHEVRLLEALARWRLPHALPPLAVDAERGRVLLPDGGPTVREVAPADAGAAARRWADVLAGYAQVQAASTAHADDLVALGVPDLRLPVLPEVAAELVRRWAPQVRDQLPRLREEAAELAELGPAAALQHDDLHDGNVFAAGGRPFDWGDACVAHPFTSLLVALDVPDPAPARRAYLAQWAAAGWAPADARAAERAVELGVRLGRVTRAHSWARALAAWPAPPEPFADAPGWWLRTLSGS
ncbi:aminoglycoside phosphotransferase family protein [Kineococcus sp. SYSU DK006]|uniref:aminoglycoside phosphotransferase family protein n=1 Tax=Kineococcus sp. SYSU DK006 TaxID=3383127 RepID=UPI003D7E495A